jgi:2-amino-4-hydroxy-6-hydroxymethyldihydropteridine diphosphokinase
MERVYLGLGSNLGDRANYLRQAREALQRLPLQEFQESSIYESTPLANMQQPLYYNQVVAGTTRLAPEQLLAACLRIEKQLGRVRWEHWGPRIIDIDLLSYGARHMNSQRLTIPHPELQNRSFVLLPLLELNPEWTHALSQQTVSELWQVWQARFVEELPRKVETDLARPAQSAG